MRIRIPLRGAALAAALLLASLTQARAQSRPACDPDNAGLTLPPGFCALVVADNVGRARHLTVAPNGDVFVALANRPQNVRGGVLALRDTTGDGKADVQVRFGENGGTGIALRGTSLYFGTDDAVLRYTIPAGQLQPAAPPDTIVLGLPAVRSHRAKSLALRGAELFVNIGSPSNSCQVQERQPAAPGVDPCPDLGTRAGIWKFDTNKTRQTQADGQRFATGIRNAVAITVNPTDRELYALQHGRDMLFQNWGSFYDEQQGAEKPAEIMMKVEEGDDYGWPYCYYDQDLMQQMLAPEYGGDGRRTGRCADVDTPIFAFPGHWAPNGVLFYATTAPFPAPYHGGAFIAFHGSWNRAPRPQAGYRVVFLPFRDGEPAGTYRTFADGFAGLAQIVAPNEARHRPTGLALGPDGSLYISDDAGGRIYRVLFPGTR